MSMSYRDAAELLTAPGAQFEYEERLVGGIKLRCYKNAPPTLTQIWAATERFSDVAYLNYEGNTLSYSDVRDRVTKLAAWLVKQGVEKGERVAIGMRNYPEWAVAFWATQLVGGTVVALNAWWQGPEMRHAIEDSIPRVVILDAARWEIFESIRGSIAGFQPACCVRSEGITPPESVADLGSLCSTGPIRDGLPQVTVSPLDPATMLYTSGTTGRSKAAVATHLNHTNYLMNMFFYGAVASLMATGRVVEPSSQQVLLQPYPFFHIGGLTPLYTAAATGAKLVLIRRWDARRVLGLIESERITSFAVAPTMLRQLLEHPDAERFDTSSVTGFACGAAPVPPDLLRASDAGLGRGTTPTVGYGLTEVTGVSALSGDAWRAKLDSVGRPFPVLDVRIVDPESMQLLAAGVVGEVQVRGPTVAQGYWNNPQATAGTFVSGGWFRTGDLGYLDSDGDLYIVDRLKDVVIRGGENVYCAEVEATLYEHPAVVDVAVLGQPHQELGEEVVAVVNLNAPVTAEELRTFVGARLAYFKVPERIHVWSEPLPRNATGKVMKRDLRSSLTAGERTV